MNTTERRVYFILSVLLWIYLWLRAWQVPIIYDEVATFYHYIHKGEFLPYFAHWDANNHIINSALGIVSYNLFGSSPLALRLPNLLVSVIFFIYCFRISGEIRNVFLRWTFILSLLFAHSFIDYFTLCRGYGMSMAFLFGGIWYLMRSVKEVSTKNYLLTLLFLNLSVLANLTLIFSLFIVIGLLFLNLIKRKRIVVPAVVCTIFGLLPAAFFVKLLFFMKAKGLLYYGSTSGFKSMTIWSLVKYFLSFESGFIEYFLIALFFGIVIVLAFQVVNSKEEHSLFNTHFIFGYLLIGNVAAILLNAWVFDVNYPEDRAGLFLFPYFVGSLIFLADNTQHHMLRKVRIGIAALLLIFPIHFFMHTNLSHNSLENFRILQRFYDKVLSEHTEGEPTATIGGSHNKELMWSYLNFRNGAKLSQMNTRSYPSLDLDYQITGYENEPNWFSLYDTLDYDPQTGFCLAKRKHFIEKSLIHSRNNIAHKEKSKREYFSILKGKTDSLLGKSLVVNFSLNTIAEAKPFESWVVFDVRDKNNKGLRYERIPYDWLRTDWSDPEKPMINTIYVKDLPPESDNYILFFWNINKVEYQIIDGEASIFALEE